MPFDFPAIAEASGIDRTRFEAEIRPASQPVVMRGLARDWPAVRAARESFTAVAACFKRHDTGQPVQVWLAPAEAEGRYFYSDDMRGYNFRSEPRGLSEILDWLASNAATAQVVSAYVQSVPLNDLMPGFVADHPMPLLGPVHGPRLWVGNRLRTQTHFDPSHNMAVLVAGRRRFTLFPPDQTPNLYPGPFDTGPGGVPISLASLEAPDFEAHPNFRKALETAQTTELEAGDALYIPYGWWHHVRSLEGANILVNYWWNEGPVHPSPFIAFFAALMTLRDLPPPEKAIWRDLMDAYVFSESDNVGHIPEHARSGFGPMTPEVERRLKGIMRAMLGI